MNIVNFVLTYLAGLAIALLMIWPATLLLTWQVRRSARRFAEQVDEQVEVNDHIVRLIEDLIRIQPERAEVLEIARLDLRAWQERQRQCAAARHAVGELHRPWRALPKALKAWRDRRRSNRNGGAR